MDPPGTAGPGHKWGWSNRPAAARAAAAPSCRSCRRLRAGCAATRLVGASVGRQAQRSIIMPHHMSLILLPGSPAWTRPVPGPGSSGSGVGGLRRPRIKGPRLMLPSALEE